MKESIKDWQPSYKMYTENGAITLYYERSWYCQENYIIHHSEKAVLNCSHCSNKYY